MTTTSEKLRTKAAELRRQADACELSAAVMDGVELVGKQRGAQALLHAAVKLRNGQRNGHQNGHSSPPESPQELAGEESKADRPGLIRIALRGGPQSLGAIQQYLSNNGLPISKSWLQKTMLRMPDVMSRGRSRAARWHLVPIKQARPDRADRSHAERRAAGLAKLRILAGILSQQKKPMPIKDLAAAAREQGVAGLTGISGYVTQGYLKPSGKRGDLRYRLTGKTLPDAVTTS